MLSSCTESVRWSGVSLLDEATGNGGEGQQRRKGRKSENRKEGTLTKENGVSNGAWNTTSSPSPPPPPSSPLTLPPRHSRDGGRNFLPTSPPHPRALVHVLLYSHIGLFIIHSFMFVSLVQWLQLLIGWTKTWWLYFGLCCNMFVYVLRFLFCKCHIFIFSFSF